MKKWLIFILFLAFFWSYTQTVEARSLAVKLAGKILLNVEKNGEAWYVYPFDNRRYFLGRPSDAFALMRELGLGIREIDFQRLVKSNMPAGIDGDKELALQLSGRIILQVEKNGEAWYVYPDDLRVYYLGRPADAFTVMRKLSLGISRTDLARIHKPGLIESINKFSSYEHKKINITTGIFNTDIVRIDLDNPNLEIITDTANIDDCEQNCSARSLADFVLANQAFAGINASYFDTSSIKANYYFAPVWNTKKQILFNQDQLKYWTTGPIVAFDTKNNFYYFKDSREFSSVENFENSYHNKLQALMSNRPRLVENGMNQLVVWQVDNKQENCRAVRNALAYKQGEFGSKGELFLVVVHNATLPELAEVLKALKIDTALNLDGGSSSALWYNDEYMVGPGRNIPNVILFKEKHAK